MDEAIKAAVRIAEDYMDRLREAEEAAQHWQEVAGREALRAKDLERRLMTLDKPNGSEA